MHWLLTTLAGLLRWLADAATHPVAILVVLIGLTYAARALIWAFADLRPAARRDVIEALRALRGRK